MKIKCLQVGPIGTNCYLLGEAGRAVVIDPNDPRGPLERLEALAVTPLPCRTGARLAEFRDEKRSYLY